MIQFHTEYLKIPKEDIPFSDREAQTIATASTLSSLVYSYNPIGDLQQRNLHQSITELWPLAGRNGEMLIAWSAPLDTCFVVFRGTATLNDWTETNLRTAKTYDEANNWGVHKGFHARAAKSPAGVIASLIQSGHRTVICGHSLGGALATVAGLTVPSPILGKTPMNAWSDAPDSPDTTSHMSVVTFGAPSVMVKKGTDLSEPARKLRKLFHNIIDPDDIVPTAFNRAKEFIQKVVVGLNKFGAGFTGSAISHILAALDLFDVDHTLYGAHVGTIIICSGTNSFIRMSEINKALVLASLSKEMKVTTKDEAMRLANHHGMTSYTTKWEGHVTDNHSQSWTAHSLQAAQVILDTIVPSLANAITQADQNPVDESIDFAVRITDHRALHAFAHATIAFKAIMNGTANAKIDHIIAADSVELRFSFGITSLPAGPTVGDDRRWKELFAAAETLTLIDIFGRSHSITLPDGVLCPTLSSFRHESTASFIKAAMLKAVALQVAFSHENQSGADNARLSPGVILIVALVDQAIQRANVKRFVDRLNGSFEAVAAIWESALPEDDIQAKPSDPPDVSARSTTTDCIPNRATGRLRILLTDLVDALRKAPRTNQFGEVSGRLSFREALLSYTTTIDRAEGAASNPANTIRTILIVISLVIHTQLTVDPNEPLEKVVYTTMDNVAGSAALLAIEVGLIALPYLWGMAAAFGTMALLGSVLSDGPTSKLAYDQALASALEQLGLADGRPMSSASAEAALAEFANQTVEEIQSIVSQRHISQPERKKPTQYFYQWIKYVALIGSLRMTVSARPAIGTFGPVRSGKSQLLTTVFALSPEVFNPGSMRRNRTLHFRAMVTDTALISDAPGLDERDTDLHEASRLLVDLLDIVIVVINLSLIEAESGAKLVRTLAQLLQHRNGQPVCILINRVDEIITDSTIEDLDDWLINVDDQKMSLVRQLKEALGGKEHLDIMTSVQHPDPSQSDRRFVRQATVSLEDVVHVSCLLDFERSAVLAPKREVLRALRTELKGKGDDLWDCNNVRRWIHEVCPEAMPNYLRFPWCSPRLVRYIIRLK